MSQMSMVCLSLSVSAKPMVVFSESARILVYTRHRVCLKTIIYREIQNTPTKLSFYIYFL